MKLAAKCLLLVLVFFSLSGFNFGANTSIACTTITGSYATLATFPSTTRSVFIQNTCNQIVVLSNDASTDGLTLLSGVGGVFEFKDMIRDEANPDSTISIKHDGVAPTDGTFVFTVLY